MNPTTPGAAPQYPPQPAAPPPPPVTVVQPPPPRPVLERAEAGEPEPRELTLVSHSPLVYWWPVWVIGYVFAALTWWAGRPYQVGAEELRFHPDSNIGVLFFLTLFLVIVVSNINVRGYASLTVVMGVVLVAVVMAYFGAWGPVLGWFGDLNVYLNQGAYFWFATLLFAVWVVTVFVVDRFTYWRITPGQITYYTVFGTGSRSYDTENMVLEKQRDDLFRHWLLGLGSGDLRIHTYGARAQEIFIPNVLFIGTKIAAIQEMIAIEPGKFGHVAVE